MPLEQFNDAKYGALGVSYTGSIDDRMRKAIVATAGATKSERDYWIALYPTGTGSINDVKSQYFKSLLFTGSLQDMEHAYWSSLSP